MTLKEKLTVIQTKMKAPKNLNNSFGGYKYRNAEGILEAFKPYADEYKVSLTISDTIENVGNRYYIVAMATLYDNESSESITTTAWAREPESKKGMDESQITGATSSYARKYCLNGLFLLDDTKDADTDESVVEGANRVAKEEEPMGDCKEITVFRQMLENAGVNLEKLCKQYKVNDLTELTPTQYSTILRMLNKKR